MSKQKGWDIPTNKLTQMANFFGCSTDYLLSTSCKN